jgi:hypothetical protein
MMNPQFKKAARRRRAVALALTLLFHALLIAGIVYAGESEISDLLPDPIQKWLGLDSSPTAHPAEETASPTP